MRKILHYVRRRPPAHRVQYSSSISLATHPILFLSLVPDSTPCGDPEQPVSSLVTRSSEPARVTYSCVKGYRLEGHAERVCLTGEDGRWEGEPPRCMGSSLKLETTPLACFTYRMLLTRYLSTYGTPRRRLNRSKRRDARHPSETEFSVVDCATKPSRYIH